MLLSKGFDGWTDKLALENKDSISRRVAESSLGGGGIKKNRKPAREQGD